MYSTDFGENAMARLHLEAAVRSGDKHSPGWHLYAASAYVRAAKHSSASERRNLTALLSIRRAQYVLPQPWRVALEMLWALEKSDVNQSFSPDEQENNPIRETPALYHSTRKAGGDYAYIALSDEIRRRGYVHGRTID